MLDQDHYYNFEKESDEYKVISTDEKLKNTNVIQLHDGRMDRKYMYMFNKINAFIKTGFISNNTYYYNIYIYIYIGTGRRLNMRHFQFSFDKVFQHIQQPTRFVMKQLQNYLTMHLLRKKECYINILWANWYW